MPVPLPNPRALQLLAPASHRLVRTVDALADDDWSEPTELPGWSRAHVVAHLALNAEGLAGALRGLAAGEQVPMYRSPAARDDDIAELAAAPVEARRDRLLGAVTAFADTVGAVPVEAWDTRVERTPGGPSFLAADVPGMRLREVEIHHADLAASYSWADWGPDFSSLLIDYLATGRDLSTGFVAVASDLDRTWTIGDGGPAVTGPAAALGWWLTGRGDGAGLTSEGGSLPRIGAW
ncbi:maleylpyruvate isomerase family mycothiol-dependent enzyme [Nocardioides sp. W7]|uniref:maleylpyruvate isomerase family mycothiol-dependent enzyme n=1 Tax=Nocardioides sp. W7 TaxID=2931390 RepID=UPI001FD0E38E|nr:maleylpyruvate isomerase family mycothiol-dependent enzyme [Nocardioides sp. W7]